MKSVSTHFSFQHLLSLTSLRAHRFCIFFCSDANNTYKYMLLNYDNNLKQCNKYLLFASMHGQTAQLSALYSLCAVTYYPLHCAYKDTNIIHTILLEQSFETHSSRRYHMAGNKASKGARPK